MFSPRAAPIAADVFTPRLGPVPSVSLYEKSQTTAEGVKVMDRSWYYASVAGEVSDGDVEEAEAEGESYHWGIEFEVCVC